MGPTVRVSRTRLKLLVPLSEVEPAERRALTQWLWAHGIAPSTVAPGSVLERDELLRFIFWCELQPDGRVVRRWHYEPTEETWPAPFPFTNESETSVDRRRASAPSESGVVLAKRMGS